MALVPGKKIYPFTKFTYQKIFLGLRHIQVLKFVFILDHRFLTGGPWTPKGSVERVKGVHEDQKSNILYPLHLF